MSLGMVLWVIAAMAQERGSSAAPPPPTMQMTIVGKSLNASDGKIYVNENCEVFPGLQLPMGDHKPKGEWMPEVCHLENVKEFDRHDEKKAGSDGKGEDVEIRERDYVLQNISVKPAVFEVLEMIPEGWSVESDPKPAEMDGPVGVFEVKAGPWGEARLHVRLRRVRK
ncbi:MAG TPA: hypothetical protein VHE33_07100 [Acidobacteriaceae bacterium]|nr:hypothetical protein [Acidobacteriaceae bacterium]